MANFHDFSGRRFGSWTIVRPICQAQGEAGLKGAPAGYRGLWVVQCDCGLTVHRNITAITNGHSRSCHLCMRRRYREEHHRRFLMALARRTHLRSLPTETTPS
jgi:hypothetical protein